MISDCHFRGVLVLFAVTAFGSGNTYAESPNLAWVDVFESGQSGYHTYRIPALLRTTEGTLLAFCEGRKTSRADHGDIDLLVKRSEDGGLTWSEHMIVYEEGDDEATTIGNPCPVIDHATGKIWLPFCRNNDTVFVTSSDDDGKSWTPPREITSDVKRSNWSWYATGPGVGIQLTSAAHRGRLVIPCDHREELPGASMKMSHVIYSDDAGTTWQLGESVAPHTDECQVIERADGQLMINMRNYWQRDGKRADRGGKRAISLSDDGGETWGELRFDNELIEPICQAGLVQLTADEGLKHHLVFTNPASTTERARLTIRLSDDGGETWPHLRLLYAGSSAYSCPAELPDGRVAVLCERDDYGKISLCTLSVESIISAQDGER